LSLLSSAFEGDTWALSNVKETEIMRKMDLLANHFANLQTIRLDGALKPD